MGELKTSVVIDLTGNLVRRAKRYTSSMVNFSRRSTRANRLLRRSLKKTGKAIKRMGNRYTALATGVATGFAVNKVLNLEERFVRLGIQAKASESRMNDLKKQIFEISQQPDIRINPDKITSAIAEIVEKTGDLDFAERNIRNIGLALQAIGADGNSIGGILAEFQKIGIKDPTEVIKALDILNAQGKEGAFTLQNLAALGPRVVTAYTSLGRTGVPALREMGAALQIIRQGTGSSEQAATAFEAMLRTFSDASKLKILNNSGIKVFDPEELKKGNEILKPINEIITEIVTKTKGRKTLLGRVFDAEAIRGFNAVSGEFQRTGKIDSIQKFINVKADGDTGRDSARAAKISKAAIANTSSILSRAVDEILSGPVKRLTVKTNKFLEGRSIDTLLSNLGSKDAKQRLQIRNINEFGGPWKGQLDIQIKSDTRTEITKIKSNKPSLDIEVDNGVQMVMP